MNKEEINNAIEQINDLIADVMKVKAYIMTPQSISDEMMEARLRLAVEKLKQVREEAIWPLEFQLKKAARDLRINMDLKEILEDGKSKGGKS